MLTAKSGLTVPRRVYLQPIKVQLLLLYTESDSYNTNSPTRLYRAYTVNGRHLLTETLTATFLGSGIEANPQEDRAKQPLCS